MKPTLGMEGEKTAPVIFQQNMDKPKRNRLIVGIAVGMAALVIVAAIVAVSVYLGVVMTRDSYKEARQTFHTSDGKVVEEETKVTKDEVSVRVPNEIELVYDYKNGLMVERYIDTETKEKSACYARFMNETETPSNNADDYTDGEVSLSQSTNIEEEKWKSTTRKVPRHMVSEKVAEMCKDTEIFWMQKMTSDEETKRAACVYSGYKYVCVKLTPKCLYRCTFWYFCQKDGQQYLFATRTANYCLNACSGDNNPCP